MPRLTLLTSEAAKYGGRRGRAGRRVRSMAHADESLPRAHTPHEARERIDGRNLKREWMVEDAIWMHRRAMSLVPRRSSRGL